MAVGSNRVPYMYVSTKGERVNSGDILQDLFASTKAESKQLIETGDAHTSVAEGGLQEPLYSFELLVKLMKMNSTHYRCCVTKSREAGSLGYKIVPTDENANSEESDENEGDSTRTRLREFFDSLEEPITQTFFKMLMDYSSMGNGALELIYEGDTPEDIKHIPVRYVRRHTDRERFCEVRGARRAWFVDASVRDELEIDWQTGQEMGSSDDLDSNDGFYSDYSRNSSNFSNPGSSRPPRDQSDNGRLAADEPTDRRANSMVWFSNYDSESDYYGAPDIISALGALIGDLSRRDYNMAFFDNYGVPAYAVFVTGNFDPGEPQDAEGNPDPNGRTPLEAAVEDHFAHLQENPHATLFLSIPSSEDQEGDVEVRIERIGHDTQDASFRMYRMDNRDEILSAHGVPAERAGIHVEGALGGNVAAESSRIYKQSILDPLQEMIENAINRFVVREGFGINDWKIQLNEIDVRDIQAEYNRDIQAVGIGAMSPNDFRKRWEMDRVDDPAMDLHYMAQNPIDASEDEIPPSLNRNALSQRNGSPVNPNNSNNSNVSGPPAPEPTTDPTRRRGRVRMVEPPTNDRRG